MSCDEVRDLAAELALGVLDGAERAAALHHLAACDTCRDLVADLAQAADGLLLIAPCAEPPPGFESRVLDRLAGERVPVPTPLAPARRRSVLVGSIAAALLILLGAGAGWVAARPDDDLSQYFATLRAVGGHTFVGAPMEDPEGDRVGEVFLYEGDPSWVFMSLDGWHWEPGSETVDYQLRVDLVDGRHMTVDHIGVDAQAGWGEVLHVKADDVRWIGVVDTTGRVYCGAQLDV